jgi:hypothetical protein
VPGSEAANVSCHFFRKPRSDAREVANPPSASEPARPAASFAAAFGTFPAIPDQILVGGVSGAIVSSGPSQVNFVVPASTAQGLTTVSALAGGLELGRGEMTITARCARGISFWMMQTHRSQAR